MRPWHWDLPPPPFLKLLVDTLKFPDGVNQHQRQHQPGAFFHLRCFFQFRSCPAGTYDILAYDKQAYYCNSAHQHTAPFVLRSILFLLCPPMVRFSKSSNPRPLSFCFSNLIHLTHPFTPTSPHPTLPYLKIRLRLHARQSARRTTTRTRMRIRKRTRTTRTKTKTLASTDSA